MRSGAVPRSDMTAYHYANTATNKKLDYIDHPMSGRTSYHYNAKGLLEYEWYQGNDTYNYYGYDSLNRVDYLHVLNSQLAMSYYTEDYTYNEDSMRTRIDYSGYDNNGVAWTPYHRLYKYDNVLRLTEQHKRWNSNNATAWRYAYDYDPAGNRTEMVHFDGTTTVTTGYVYNDGNQLSSTTKPGEFRRYVFDDNGNMIQMNDGEKGGDEWNYIHNRENRLLRYADNGIGYSYQITVWCCIKRPLPDRMLNTYRRI